MAQSRRIMSGSGKYDKYAARLKNYENRLKHHGLLIPRTFEDYSLIFKLLALGSDFSIDIEENDQLIEAFFQPGEKLNNIQDNIEWIGFKNHILSNWFNYCEVWTSILEKASEELDDDQKEKLIQDITRLVEAKKSLNKKRSSDWVLYVKEFFQGNVPDKKLIEKSFKTDEMIKLENHDSKFQEEIKKVKREITKVEGAHRQENEQIQLVGQTQAHDSLEKVIAIAKVNKARKSNGLKDIQVSLHAVFAGPPGTGKTTFARYYAKKIKEIGILKKGHVVEASRSDLVAAYQGQTAIKTEMVVKSALGGILFIDEAYSLKSSTDDSYGQEAIDTLVKLIEDHRADLIVILAGYDSEMRDFLSTNTGLKSRIPNWIEFQDFSNDELQRIFLTMCKERDIIFNEKEMPIVMEAVLREKKGRSFGNARTVRNILEKILSKQSIRLSKATESLARSDYQTIIRDDVTDAFGENILSQVLISQPDATNASAATKLSQLIGLTEAKSQIEEIIALLQVMKLRKGKIDLSSFNLHMIFSGNPGTGKTTVARMLGEIFKEMGVLPSGHVVEVDRSGLVAGYVGQTAIKTKEVVESAFGGVLFIDEAYAINQGASDSFGRECVDTLVKMMEDFRDKFVLIVAGYPDKMIEFMQMNAGLSSRFSKTIAFEDYSPADLILIFEGLAQKEGLKISQDAVVNLKIIFSEARTLPTFANARTARQIFEDSMKYQSMRIFKARAQGVIKDDLALITVDDIARIRKPYAS